MKLLDYLTTSVLKEDDVFLLDGADGTRNVKYSTLADLLKARNEIKSSDQLFDWLDEIATPEMRKNIFRGKNLGNALTKEQAKNIVNGSFKGFFIGDYWSMNSRIWRIADMDYWYKKRYNNQHHILLLPDDPLVYDTVLDTSKYISYINSYYRKTIMPNIVTNICNVDFKASDIYTHKEMFVAEVSSTGDTTAFIETDSIVDLMNEYMVFGSRVIGKEIPSNVLPKIQDLNQLKLFLMAPEYMTIPIKDGRTVQYWLRDIPTYSVIPTYITVNGISDSFAYLGGVPNNNLGIRPTLGITGAATAA